MFDHLGVFDLETTGTDVDNDRIVTAFVGTIGQDGNVVTGHTWLVNPGIPIPAEASAIHGITDEQVADGTPAMVAIAEIIDALVSITSTGIPLVVYNAAYDLTLLDRESRRHHHGTGFSVDGVIDIVDPLVIDKAVDRFRAGSRRLADVAKVVGVPVLDAHDARADCIMAAGIAFAQLAKLEGRPRAELSLSEVPFMTYMQNRQKLWKQEQADSFQDYLRRTKDPHAVIDGHWPQIPFAEVGSEPTA